VLKEIVRETHPSEKHDTNKPTGFARYVSPLEITKKQDDTGERCAYREPTQIGYRSLTDIGLTPAELGDKEKLINHQIAQHNGHTQPDNSLFDGTHDI